MEGFTWVGTGPDTDQQCYSCTLLHSSSVYLWASLQHVCTVVGVTVKWCAMGSTVWSQQGSCIRLSQSVGVGCTMWPQCT